MLALSLCIQYVMLYGNGVGSGGAAERAAHMRAKRNHNTRKAAQTRAHTHIYKSLLKL